MILTMEEFVGPSVPSEGDDEVLDSSSEDDEFGENEVLVQNFDPKAALKDLRDQVARVYDLELNEYKFWLQDSEELDDMSCLADHCIEDSGFVEVHFEIVIQGGIKKIIILDVVRVTNTNNEESNNSEAAPSEVESLEEKSPEETVTEEGVVEVMLEEIKEEPMEYDGMIELSQEISQALEQMENNVEVKPEPVDHSETIANNSVGFFELDSQQLLKEKPHPNVVILESGKIPERSSPYKVATVSDAKMIQSAPVMELSTKGGNTGVGTVMVTTIETRPANVSTFASMSMPRRMPVPQVKRVIPEVIRHKPSTSEYQGSSSMHAMSSRGPANARPMNKPLTVRLKQPSRTGPRWVVDKKFLAEMANQNMSRNPREWSVSCVLRWYLYVKARYNIEDKYDQFWRISGAGLYELTERQVTKMVPRRCLQDFWTHLELMRKCNVIAFLQRFDESEERYIMDQYRMGRQYGPFVDPLAKTYHAGTPQLWQFLLDLLSDYRYYHVIRWTNDYGQFKFYNPVEAATMWGDRKKKPYMNYEKLSRAIRYYYEDKLIVKVSGERFTYRFTCDLKPIIGFTSAELKRRVEETVMATRRNKKP